MFVGHLQAMNKRSSASSCPRRGPVGDDKDSGVELSNPRPTPSRKKKKMEQSEICLELYDIIRTYKKDDETLLCEAFIRNPSRRQDPQYYEVVSKPIDLIRIQQKFNRNIYEDIEDLSADIELLVNNAKLFYKPDTEEYKDATNLWKLYNKHRQSLDTGTYLEGEEVKTSKLTPNASSSRQPDVAEDTSEAFNDEDDNVFEELFNAVMSENRNGYGLYAPFVFLPSERKYPDYLEKIKSPIDLKTIAQKIQAREYTDLNDLEKDLLLLVRNACLYNEPGCQLYKDAKTLKKVVQDCKQDIEQRVHGGPSTSTASARSKPPRRASVPSSRALAVMEPPAEDAEPDDKHSEDSADDILEDETDNEVSPQWKLLETVWNHEGPCGTPIAQPFYKLPSRRDYEDYYLKIKNPVSLKEIKKKIKRGCYDALSDVAEDMNIMFENAKEYNNSTSRIHKYAVKLQRLMQERVQELLNVVQISSSDDESLSSVQNQVRANTPRPRGRPNRSTSVGSKSNVQLKKKLHCVSKQLDKKKKSKNLIKHSNIWFVNNTININFN